MACTAPLEAFRVATEYLGEELYHRAYWRGIFLNLINRDEYMRGAGLSLRSFTIGRSEPQDDEEDWLKVTVGANGSCGVTWNDVDYGMNEVTYVPETFGLRGPIICQDDLIYNFNTDRFLESYMTALERRSRRSIENRLMNIYMHFVGKNTTDEAFTFTAESSASPPIGGPLLDDMLEPTCPIRQDHLDTVAAELNELGASDPDTDGWINLGEDGPIYPLYIGQTASHDILKQEAQLRQDYRDADSGKGSASQLLKRMGATKVIKNFRHVINLYPPRFYFFRNDFVRMPTWVRSSGTKGYVYTLNPYWKAAPFEAAIVLSPWVFRCEVIRPVNASAGLSWSPKNYFGEWKWVLGGNTIMADAADCYDPTEKLGRHFGEYKHAPRPIFPEYGRLILFRRCPTDLGCLTGEQLPCVS